MATKCVSQIPNYFKFAALIGVVTSGEARDGRISTTIIHPGRTIIQASPEQNLDSTAVRSRAPNSFASPTQFASDVSLPGVSGAGVERTTPPLLPSRQRVQVSCRQARHSP